MKTIRYLVIVYFTLLIVVSSAICGGGSDIQLLISGGNYRKDVTATNGEFWYGLYPSLTGFDLKKTKIIVKPNSDRVQITDSEGKSPIFYIKGGSFNHDTVIKTVFYGYFPFNDIKHSLNLLMDNKPQKRNQYGLIVRGEGKRDKHGKIIGYDNCKLVLFHLQSNMRQSLQKINLGVDNPTTLIWAGDLDLDGNIDLLMNMPKGDAGAEYVLFLSSLSDDNEILKKVAIFIVRGC